MKNNRKKAEEFFNLIAQNRKKMIDIPLNFSQGEQGMLLYLAFTKNGSTASELSSALNVSLPRIMSVVNSLEAKSMITKDNDPKDKRKTIIFINKKGKKVVEESKEKAIDKITKIVDKLDEKDIDDYIRIAKKITNIVKDLN